MIWRPFAQFLRLFRPRHHHRDMWRVARDLSPLTLKADGAVDGDEDGFGFSLADLDGRTAPPRFLGYYSEAGMDRALRAYGFVERLQRRGFGDICVRLTREDAHTSTFRLYGVCDGPSCSEQWLIAESRCRLIPLPRPRWLPESALRDLGGELSDSIGDAVRLEWLLLQNPCATFSPERPRLPGQAHPGLGLGREVMELLRILGWRLNVSAYFINPFYVHNAMLYARKFLFFEPEDQGWFLALVHAAGERPMQQIALAVQNGFLTDARTDEPVGWPSRPQISPLVRPLIRLYRSPAYTDAALRAFARTRLRFDWDGYDREHARLVALLEEEESKTPAGERHPHGGDGGEA